MEKLDAHGVTLLAGNGKKFRASISDLDLCAYWHDVSLLLHLHRRVYSAPWPSTFPNMELRVLAG